MPLSKEEIDKIKAEAKIAALAEIEADAVKAAAEAERIKNIAIEVGDSGADKLMAAVEAKMAEKDASIEAAVTAVTEMKAELEKQSEEMLAMTNSKMRFTDTGGVDKLSNKEKDNAVLLAKIIGKDVKDTDFGQRIITKSSGTHGNTAMTENWEQEFSTRMLEDIELALVIEPLFTNIPMSTVTMHMPVNPQAGYAQWITAYADTAVPSTQSTGADENHSLEDFSITAYKLASKDRVEYEEEEDLIVPFLSIIRDAAVARMARASDNALLIGAAGSASPSNSTFTNNYPFDGLATYATADSNTFPTAGTATVLELQKTRRLLGKYGLNPNDIVYIINSDTYYDILEDAEFRTVEKVGNAATALRGQVGQVNGVPVILSAEFVAEGLSTVRGVCVNMRNYVKGTLRGLMVERDRDIESQSNLIVATRRFGMKELFTGATGEASCAAYLTAAS